MRVLIISSGPKDSGCFLRAQGLAEGLRSAGADVYLVNPPYTQPFFLDYLVSLLGNLLLTFWRRFDLAVAIKPFPNACLPLMIQKLYGAQVVVDVDDIDHAYRPGRIGRLIRFLQRPWPRRCSLVTYHNPLLVNYIKHEFGVPPERTFRLLQGVRLGIFRAGGRLGRRKFAAKPLIGYSAHLNVAAEGDFILRLMARLRRKLPGAGLLVVGGGPDLAKWRRLAKQHGVADAVSFTGYLPHQAVAEQIAGVDCCLIYYPPGEANRMRSSIKLREYLALGKRVVCNRYGELASFSKYCYQCDDKLDDYLKTLVELHETGGDGRERLGKKLVEKECDWDRIAEGFLGCINSLGSGNS